MEGIGPLHYKMYAKIQYQDELTKALTKENAAAYQDINEKMPPVERGDMAILIDQENVHGWLASRVERVEIRLARALATVTDFEAIMFAKGKEAARAFQFATVEDVFAFSQNFLLDAMPCDRALEALIDKDEEKLLMKQNVECHLIYEDTDTWNNPDALLDSTCAGDHDHDDHENFHAKETDSLPTESTNEHSQSRFYRARYAWLKGFLEDSKFQVKRVGAYDFLLF